MKRIFYGLAGDGLGHASRTQAIIENLPDDIEVHLFTFGQAHQFFKEMDHPHLHEIEGLMWHNKPGGISMWKTLWKGKGLLTSRWKKNVSNIHRMGIDLRPDLYISDFEPSVARAAHRSKIPLVSIDNQHRFSHCYRRGLSLTLQWHCMIMGTATRFLIPNPDKVVISSFHKDMLKPCDDNVVLVDGVMRKSIREHSPSDANFVLVYARHGFSEPIFKSLLDCDDHEFKVYGATEGKMQQILAKRRNFSFSPLSPEFANDLARCSKLIAPSGHQLLSEVKYLGKPILTIPQQGQWEQHVNAYYADKMGMGKMCHLKDLNYEVVKDFLRSKSTSTGFKANGIHKIIEVIQSYL